MTERLLHAEDSPAGDACSEELLFPEHRGSANETFREEVADLIEV